MLRVFKKKVSRNPLEINKKFFKRLTKKALRKRRVRAKKYYLRGRNYYGYLRR